MKRSATKTSKAMLICDKKFSWLRPVFNELGHWIEDFIDWHDDEAAGDLGEPPYWNNETASVSMLVAAAAQRRFKTLADYRTDKKKKGKTVNGRADLFIGHGDDWLEIEAKQINLVPKSGPQRLQDAIRSAKHDASCLAGQDPRAALVFAVMNIDAKDEQENWKPTAFLEQFDAVNDAALKWVWYDTSVDKRYGFEGGTRRYPGLGIFLFDVQPSRKSSRKPK